MLELLHDTIIAVTSVWGFYSVRNTSVHTHAIPKYINMSNFKPHFVLIKKILSINITISNKTHLNTNVSLKVQQQAHVHTK